MTWEEVCADPCLQDLPYRIELNQWGNIEMSPIWIRHSELQGEVRHLLSTLRPAGMALAACAVETAENVKVSDVVWVSFERRRSTPHEFAYAVAPEICVEILSPSNQLEEMMHKGALYLRGGAEEFWLCDDKGTMSFFDTAGKLERSRLCPQFPTRVEIPD